MAMPVLDWAKDPVEKLRAGYDAGRLEILDQCPYGVAITPHDFITGAGLCFTPEDVTSEIDILYIHGGGWIVGSPWTHRTLCAWMAKLTGRRVYSAPYRLAPEHQFPAQAEDAAAVVDEFAASRDQIILAGDSAGGAMIVWGESAAQHRSKVTALVSLYGAFGVHDSRSIRKYGTDKDGLSGAALLAMYEHLGCLDVTDFQARFARDGAPIFLVKSELDAVADDNDWFAANTERSVTHLTAKGQEHAFLQFCGSNSAAHDCMAHVAEWLDGLVG